MKVIQSLLLILSAISLPAQDMGTNLTNYENLVFEGAGIRGIAYVGAIKELENNNILASIKNVAGTSAGGITALLLSLGYNSDEIEKIIYDTKLNKFNDGKFIFIGGFYRTARTFGWYQGKSFEKWIVKLIKNKALNPDITFKELHDKGFKDLFITGVSLNRQKLLVFSYKDYPNMKIKDAVRITMSIPFYYQPLYIDSAGLVINKPKDKNKFDLVVDGGIIGNFPIFIFDSVNSEGKRIPNDKTLGIRIDSELQIEYDKQNQELAPFEITHFNSYVNAFYTYIIENLNRSSLTETDWKRTISVSSSNIGPKVRKLPFKEKELLINNGETAVKNYFKQ